MITSPGIEEAIAAMLIRTLLILSFICVLAHATLCTAQGKIALIPLDDGLMIPVVITDSTGEPDAGTTVNSVSRKVGNTTFTWTFSKKVQAGNFVNGDPWVVGPVTVTAITPNDPNFGDSLDIHGSMVNGMVEMQGWSNHSSRNAKIYRRSQNIARALPFTVNPTSSIITLEAITDNRKNDAGFESGAVLTVVDAPVAVGTFRPPYYSASKPPQWRTWTEASLNYDAFADLNPTANSPRPDNDDIRKGIDYLFIDIRNGGGQGNTDMKITGAGGGADYGREVAISGNNAVLALNSNFSDTLKRDLMIATVQRGIDAYGGLLAGYRAPPDGGHNHGRKVLFMATAAALNDSDMLAKLNSKNYQQFQEDSNYVFVDQVRIDSPHWRGEADYTQAMLGMPEWGDKARPNRSSPDFAYTGYRYITGSNTVGFVLNAKIMGLRDEIDNEAMFQYAEDRYINIFDGKPEQTGWPRVLNDDSSDFPGLNSTNGIKRGVHEMWHAYAD